MGDAERGRGPGGAHSAVGVSGAVEDARTPEPGQGRLFVLALPRETVAGRDVPSLLLVCVGTELSTKHGPEDGGGERARQTTATVQVPPHIAKQSVNNPYPARHCRRRRTPLRTRARRPPASPTSPRRSRWWACHTPSADPATASSPGIVARPSAMVVTSRSTQHSANPNSTRR